MKRFFCVVLCFLLLFIVSACNKKKESSFNAFAILELPESEIDISKVAIGLAKELYPSIDEEKYQAQLNSMVDDIKARTRGITDPDFRIRVINTYLVKEKGFGYDYFTPESNSNKFLTGLLDTKKGTCITLPLLYVVLGQKLGYPIYPVLVPDHSFVRYADPKAIQGNIEATNGGGYSPDWQYIRDFQVSEVAIKSGAHMKNLTYKEYAAELIAISAYNHFVEKSDREKGLRYIDLAMRLSPKTPENYSRKATFYKTLHNEHLAKNDIQGAVAYNGLIIDLTNKAKESGLVRLPRDEYYKYLEAKRNKLKNQGQI